MTIRIQSAQSFLYFDLKLQQQVRVITLLGAIYMTSPATPSIGLTKLIRDTKLFLETQNEITMNDMMFLQQSYPILHCKVTFSKFKQNCRKSY